MITTCTVSVSTRKAFQTCFASWDDGQRVSVWGRRNSSLHLSCHAMVLADLSSFVSTCSKSDTCALALSALTSCCQARGPESLPTAGAQAPSGQADQGLPGLMDGACARVKYKQHRRTSFNGLAVLTVSWQVLLKSSWNQKRSRTWTEPASRRSLRLTRWNPHAIPHFGSWLRLGVSWHLRNHFFRRLLAI